MKGGLAPMKCALAALLCVLLCASLGGCTAPQRYEATFLDCFDTVITLTAYAPSRQAYDRWAEAARDELMRLHRLFDIFNAYQGLVNLKTINDGAGGAALAVEGDILELLAFGLESYAASGGTVNIALGPVTALWREARETAERTPSAAAPPEPAALEAALALCDPSDILLDAGAGTVRLARPGMSLDVGAIAKGWAAGKAMEAARAAGLTSGVLNAGGNVVTCGAPQDGRTSWQVGIRNPRAGEADAPALLGAVAVGAAAVVSSGDYERYFVADGVRYHHILDPYTGYPASRYRAVTLLAASSARADMLSTALFVLPLEEGRRLAALYQAEALWVEADGSVTTTGGFPPLR